LRVALDLFTEKGFEGTSVRDISEALGMTKSSLYYHFTNKDDIVASLMKDRLGEVDELVEWIEQHSELDGLLRAAALRWLDRTTPDRLKGMRLAQSNQPAIRRMAGSSEMGDSFRRVFHLILGPNATVADQLHTRLVFDAVNAVLLASRGSDASSDDVLAVARRMVIELT